MIYLILNNRLIANNRCVNDNIFEQWKMEHEAKNECGIKFEGSSPAMEAEGELVVWERSISHHNLRYRWMVSDGDSKAHSSVYTDCKVEKLDYVGHIHRRMGKHLLNLKANTKGKLDDGKTIGGKGRLTEVKRKKKLQKYYGLAIRQNTISKPSPSEQEINVAVLSDEKEHNFNSSP